MPPSNSSSLNYAHITTGSTGFQQAVFESKIEQFMKLARDATLDQAGLFLDVTEGDIDEALVEFTKDDSFMADRSDEAGSS